MSIPDFLCKRHAFPAIDIADSTRKKQNASTLAGIFISACKSAAADRC
jgi:hypothetical protein